MNEPLVLNLEPERGALVLELQEDEPLSIEIKDPVPVFGTRDYVELINKPQINGVELVGNKTSKQLNIQETTALSNIQIEQIIQSVF